MSVLTETGAPAEAGAPAPARPARNRWLAAGAVVLALLLGVGVGLVIPLLGRPADDSVEAGFLRDMSNHHAQAVQLAMIEHERGTDANVRRFAADIALTQHGQMNIMGTWLRGWGLSPTGSQPAMAWMPDAEGSVQNGLMPGMATPEQMDALRAATGRQIDIQFLTLMRRHHLGGVHMAQGIVKLSDHEDVTWLAGTMVAAQQGEIALIDDLLKTVQGRA